MAEEALNTVMNEPDYAQLRRENEALKAELTELKQQLAWLKRQLFGRKSEKRLVDDDKQTGLLFEALPESDSPPPPKRSNTPAARAPRAGASPSPTQACASRPMYRSRPLMSMIPRSTTSLKNTGK